MIDNCFRQICVLLLILFLIPPYALAHKVTVFAWVEGDKVFGESKFSGGRKAQGAQVIVQDLTGKELLRTQTDESGEFSFQIPGKTGMRIELIAGMGHKGEWTIPLEEIDETAQENTVVTSPPASSSVSGEKVTAPSFSNTGELESIIETSVEKSLDKKMKPLMMMMADLQQKGPGMNEIIGGIGYIFGLMGVALYFKSRKSA